MKIVRILSILVLLVSIFILFSCSPERIKPTPGNYIIQGDQDTGPAFSPDGNFIAYQHDDTNSNSAASYATGLYIMDRNGNNRKLVLSGVHLDPAWSPDGQWLIFSTLGVIQKCKINGESLTTLTALNSLSYPEFYYPDWSTSGRYILFDKPFGLDWGFYSTTDTFQSSIRYLGLTILGRNPELSPDEGQLLYEAGKGGGTLVAVSEIFVLEPATTNKIQLTNNGRDNRAPTWSPDGLRIAWSSSIRLSIMNADGSNQREVGFGNNPSWSINNEIVFSHANADFTKEVLYIISPDGSNKKQVTF